MKKTALILTFLVCFISYQGFAGGNVDVSEIKKGITKLEGDVKDINGKTTKLEGDVTGINGRITKLEGGGGGGDRIQPGPRDNTTNQATSSRIPVTPKIVQFLLNNNGSYDGLKFYLSKPFTLNIYEQNETAEIEIVNSNMIVLNPVNPANIKPIKFSIDSEGILVDILPQGADKGREIQIRFNEQGKILIFARNTQQNCYELFDVKVIDNRNYKVNIPEPIQLYVSGQNKRESEVQAVPSDFTYNPNQPPFDTGYNNPYQNRNVGSYNDNYSYNANYNSSANSSRSVIGTGSTNPQRVIAFARKRNPSLSNSAIAVINEYFEEARNEVVNVDFAIAQMLYATNYLKRVVSYNYGGLNGCSFSSMHEGVQAHIQHLKAYARQRPKRQLVDPRFSLAWERGFSGITFDRVYPIWSPNPSYRQRIEEILRNL
jgi:hypothetical protein